MSGFKATIKKRPEAKHPDKWTEVIIHGIDSGGNHPLFLGFLWDRNIINTITHIVTKMPGYAWYYNQYVGTQYSPVSVNIYRVNAYMEFDDRIEFEVDLPWSEEFNPPKKGK